MTDDDVIIPWYFDTKDHFGPGGTKQWLIGKRDWKIRMNRYIGMVRSFSEERNRMKRNKDKLVGTGISIIDEVDDMVIQPGRRNGWMTRTFGCNSCWMRGTHHCPHGIKDGEHHSNYICTDRIKEVLVQYKMTSAPNGLRLLRSQSVLSLTDGLKIYNRDLNQALIDLKELEDKLKELERYEQTDSNIKKVKRLKKSIDKLTQRKDYLMTQVRETEKIRSQIIKDAIRQDEGQSIKVTKDISSDQIDAYLQAIDEKTINVEVEKEDE